MIRTLFTEEQIRTRVRELGNEISRFYEGKNMTAIALMNGGLFFAADLMRQITIPSMLLDSFSVSSYKDDRSTGGFEIRGNLKLSIKGRDILLIDDILDTGNSLAAAIRFFEKQGPVSIRSCVFLDKNTGHEKPVRADWTGYPVEDLYVLGYGMDSREMYRNLPYIGVMEP